MCEQTEIHYLDGDVVWVKLGSSWWPGQVVGFEKLPEDVQLEFKNKPLIAAVKFFQEESFEFVKNYQQIYKYNCTQKDEFIKKGLDKYRAKSKDGSNYMDKFPQDVKTAETLTDGNPNILSSEKFNPEQKPDISGLFGDKKISKRKRTRDDSMKQFHSDIRKRVTHPRFLQENDHEIRIRQQPKHQPLSTATTSSSGSIFPCQICGFTATRVNVIICHLKSHRLNNETAVTIKSKVKMNVQPRSRQTMSDLPKRKYVKKSVPGKSKIETKVESIKRKHFKQIEKPNKKKKSDPQLREKLLADWNVESDEDESSDFTKSIDTTSTNLLIKDQPSIDSTENTDIFTEDSSKDNLDNSDLLDESNKLLQETDSFAKFSTLKDVSTNFEKLENNENDLPKLDTVVSPKRSRDSFQFKKHSVEKFPIDDDKNSRLSCFDFDEDDVPETNISSVRKMTRGLGSKNMSIKKEIIKEFEMSQALKSDLEKDVKNDNTKLNVTKNAKENYAADLDKEILTTEDGGNNEIEETNEDKIRVDENKFDNCIEICETQVEIVEIFEEHKDDENKDIKVEESNKKFEEKPDFQCDSIAANTNNQKNIEAETNLSEMKEPEIQQTSSSISKDQEMISNILTTEVKKKSTCLDDFIFENQDATNFENISTIKCVSQDLSESSVGNSQSEDNLNFCTKKRRGRPRKNLTSCEEIAIDNDHLKLEKIGEGEFDRITSESDSDRSYSGRIQKPNTKYQSSPCSQSFEYKSFKTDDSLSESEDKPEKLRTKTKGDRKYKSNSDEPADSIENLNLSLNRVDNKITVVSDSLQSICKQNSEIKKFASDIENILETEDISKTSNYNQLKEQSKVVEYKMNEEHSNTDLELLPPKKSQIKKFEKLSLIDTSDSKFSIGLLDTVNKSNSDCENSQKYSYIKTLNEPANLEERTSENTSEKNLDIFHEKMILEKDISSTSTLTNKSENPIKIDQVEESLSDLISKVEDSIVKTVQIDHSLKVNKSNDCNLSEIEKFDLSNATDEIKLNSGAKSSTQEPVVTNYAAVDNFDNIEVVVADVGVEVKSNQALAFTNNKRDLLNNEKNSPIVAQENLLTKKIIESITSTGLPVAEIEVTVPVKKREKPRIIENVALKEPMILKTKLTEKHTAKFRKHKLENNSAKLSDLKCSSNTKVMKMETAMSNNKNKAPFSSGQSPVAKKILKTLKAEDGLSTNETSNETIVDVTQKLLKVPSSEKFIQQSSQSLVDMELDINSMPFILSEDVLTPESIEQMPVVISSVLPTTTPITSSLSTTLMTSTKQIASANQSFDSPLELNEINLKKKSGTPTILKNKSKAKPTITSIKNVVPPLASAKYKGSYKINTQALQTTLGNQKTPGKYVIVQTSGHQQTYSMHQKATIPASKGSGNAQIVQQGSKVVILTSPPSGQGGQKVLPLNSISKALTNRKIQRIVTNKQGQQILPSANPQSIVGSKTVLTSKSDEFINSSISTKITGQKIANHQQTIASKSVLTQIPGTITKSTTFSNVPQGIITKDGIFTPISAPFGGKTFLSSKTLVAKGFPSQSSSSASKNILSPITQTLSGKTILNSQGIVTKGTVLTPITGSQVKALAAKNIKGSKPLCQTVQRKVQLIETQKNPKVPISSIQTQNSNMVILQNADIKTVTPLKKSIKQTVNKQTTVAAVLPSSSIVTVQPKDKVASLSLEQKIGNPKTISRMIKLPAKEVKDKVAENIQQKQSADKEIKVDQEKTIGSIPVMKSSKVVTKNLQRKISNFTTSVTPMSLNSSASLSITIPPLEPYSHEKAPKKEISESGTQILTVDETEKIDIPKIPSQAQIMALPTENSDGTQSIVLITVDEQGQGHIIPLDSNALVSLDGTSVIDGNKTIYIDSSSLGESGNMDNIVLQIDSSSLSNFQPTTSSELSPAVITETLPSSEIPQNTNQDILAVALANTDFQHDIGVAETTATTAMTSFTQTSLINQTILQSTIIPPTEPISSPSVLETSLTLNQPIMTPLEVPSSLSSQSELTPVSSTTAMPPNLKQPLSIASNSASAIKETLITTLGKKIVDMRVASSSTEIESKLISNTAYSISIPSNDFGNKQSQITPSMPLIDDSFNGNNGFDSTNASVVIEDNLRNFVTKTSEELIQDLTGNDSLQDNNETMYSKTTTTDSACSSIQENSLEIPQMISNDTQDDSVSSQHNIALSIETSEETVIAESVDCLNEINTETLNKDGKLSAEMCTASIESLNKVQSSHKTEEFGDTNQGDDKGLSVTESTVVYEEEALTSNQDSPCKFSSVPSTEKCGLEMVVNAVEEQKSMEVIEEKKSTYQISDSLQKSKSSCVRTENSLQKSQSSHIITEDSKITFEDKKLETNQETPSQSYKQLVSNPNNVSEVPSQSAKSENCQEATQSLTYKTMEIDNNALLEDPPTQSYDDSKVNKASQSCKVLHEISTNAPTQSFNEMIEINKERESMDESMDDLNFPTQSYEVGKMENCIENLETDPEISQEGNTPSQSNDIGVDGIGTSSMSTNNSGLNEDETASSSYVPETPENQERDQDQESAISTSSYEIPPCEELNIASSSVIPDTSVQSEHSSIHNNGVPEIPTSSYNLNPDSSSAHADAVPTSSYEDQIIIEQNVSTSHQVPISMANIEETGSQSYVTDSSDERNEATSYYGHNQEVTESYYQDVCKQSHSQLESNSEEEATPSYYDSNPADVTSEASGSYFNQEEATPSYSNHEISARYYDPQAEGEASQSYYASTHDLNSSSQQVALQNVEATQSFYNENSDEHRFRQGEATPTYTERYSVDYVPVSSPLDRHDLVESSVSARSMDR